MNQLESVNNYLTSLGQKSNADYGNDLREWVEKAHGKEGGLTGIDTGYVILNNKTGGWQESDLIIVAGRPGMGKTAKLISSARRQLKQGKKVAIFSLEMAGRQVLGRLAVQESNISFSDLTKGKLSEEKKKLFFENISTFEHPRLMIDDKARVTPMHIKSKLMEFKPDIVYIDYIQLMSGNKKKYGNREAEVADISRSLKEIAKELNIPVIAFAQLSRGVESRGGNKIPKLSDLRESGSIEQDADIVVLLYRPGYYNLKKDGGQEYDKGESYFIIAKHRNGSDGNCKVRFVPHCMKFDDWDNEEGIPEEDTEPKF